MRWAPFSEPTPINAGNPLGLTSFSLIKQMPAMALPLTAFGVKGGGTMALATSISTVKLISMRLSIIPVMAGIFISEININIHQHI
jgi:hypothetical protein